MLIRTIKTNLVRIFCSPSVYICSIAIGLINYMNFYADAKLYGATDLASSSIFMDSNISITNWVLCIVGSGMDYCKEVKNGYMYFNVERVGLKIYSIGKTISAFIGGFFCAFFGLLVYNVAEFFTLYHQHKDMKKAIIIGTSQSPETVLGNIGLTIFGIALFCGVLSMLGLLITTIVSDYFMGVAMPVLAWHCYVYFINKLKYCPDFLQFGNMYYYGYLGWIQNSAFLTYLYALGVTWCAGYAFYCMVRKNIKGRLQHG